MADAPNAPVQPGQPTAGTPTAPRKKSLFRRLLKGVFLLLVLVAIAVVALPSVASATFLTGTVRSQLRAQLDDGADVSKVEFSWSKGLVLDGLRIGAGPDATVKDRPPVTLEHLAVALSVPGLVGAAARNGEAEARIDVETAKVYLELHPGGKTNVPTKPPAKPVAPVAPVASETPAMAGGKKAAIELPCSARATLNVKGIDVEIADMTSSTGAIQRTVLKNLRIGVSAQVARDATAAVDGLKDEKGADLPAVSLDEVRITLEQKGQKDRIILAVEKPRVVAKLTYRSQAPDSAGNAPIAALAALHQLDAKPAIFAEVISADDFDLHTCQANVAVEERGGKRTVALVVDGTMFAGPHSEPGHEQKGHAGRVKLTISLDDLAAKPRLPVALDVNLKEVDISGAIARYAPSVCPVLGGISAEKGSNKLPTLSFDTKGELSAFFDAGGQVQKDPTLRSITDSGGLQLGKGSLEGSKILEGFLSGFDRIEMKDVVTKAMGERGLEFDSVTETFAVKDGVVTISNLEMARQGFGLHLSGTVDFGGHFDVHLGFANVMYDRCEPDVAKLLKAVDKAGGIGVKGVLGGDYAVSTPPADALAKALLDGGALDLLRSRNPRLAGKLDGFLGKTGTSAEKILSDPKAAAEEAAKKKAEEEAAKAIDRNAGKIEKATGVDADKAKKALGGLFGGGDEKKDEPKEEKKSPLPFKNPFGGD